MIIIKGTKPVNEKWQFVYITIDNYKHTVSTPVLDGEILQTYLDSKYDEYLLEIRKREYPGAIYQIQKGETELQAFEKWIAAGAENPELKDKEDKEIQPAKKIKKKPWKSTHPKNIDLAKQLEMATTIKDLKNIIKELL